MTDTPRTPAPAPTPSRPTPSRTRRLWPILAGVAVLVVVAFVVLKLLSGGDDAKNTTPVLKGSPQAPFRIQYPNTWKPLNDAQLATLPGDPAAVLRRTDGRGTFVVTVRPPVESPLDKLPRGLKARLSSQFPDFHEIGAKIVSLHGTRALIYTFARTKTGTAQSLVVVPAGNHSFTLNAVVPARSPDSAREVGAMIASFDPNGDR
jgi:hypothetical protein